MRTHKTLQGKRSLITPPQQPACETCCYYWSTRDVLITLIPLGAGKPDYTSDWPTFHFAYLNTGLNLVGLFISTRCDEFFKGCGRQHGQCVHRIPWMMLKKFSNSSRLGLISHTHALVFRPFVSCGLIKWFLAAKAWTYSQNMHCVSKFSAEVSHFLGSILSPVWRHLCH